VRETQFFEPAMVALEHVCKVHDPSYVDRFVQLELSAQEGRRIGFVQDQAIVARERLLVQGTIDGAMNALKDGIAFNIAGGTHHASIAHGEGFCMLNDQAIAARYLLDHTTVKKC
jgi:Deacetylases, including yeast histone deacetylase and acetoin utilization protein